MKGRFQRSTTPLNNIEVKETTAETNKEMDSTDDEIYFINQTNNYNMSILKGSIHDKTVDVLRDSGCSSIIVNSKFVKPKDFINKTGRLKVADGKTYNVPKVKLELNTPYLAGTHQAYCFDTDYDLIIGNVPSWKKN